MLKGSAYFLPFSSLIQTIKLNRYNDREEKYKIIFLYTFEICHNDDENHLGIPQHINWTDSYTQQKKNSFHSTGVKNRLNLW